MINDITGSLVVANEVVFNQFEKYHSINQVLNQVYVPTLPAAVITDVLTKILIPSEKMGDYSNVEPEIHVIDSNKELITHTFLPEITNMRKAHNIPGIDIHSSIRFPVVKEGIIEYILYVKGKILSRYFVSVYCTDSNFIERR